MYQVLIQNVTIIDGTGTARYSGSVASQGNKLQILPADYAGSARLVIDGTGLMVSPGFIDVHSHGDLVLGDQSASLSKLSQGVTTHVTGNCGYSLFPVNPENLPLFKECLASISGKLPGEMENFHSFKNYRAYVEGLSFPENVMILAGHVAIRIAAMGFENRKPTKAELDNMKSMLREAMENGAAGFSTGLIYIPSVYAEMDEIVELAGIAARYGGFYATHMRNEGRDVCKAVDEAIETARRSGADLIISHHKVAGKSNWGLSSQTLEKIEQANQSGIRVMLDQYPYTAGMSHLNICIPPKYFTKGVSAMIDHLKNPAIRDRIKQEIMEDEGSFESWVKSCGGFDGILIARAAKTPDIEGQRIGDYAARMGKDPADVLLDVLIENDGTVSAIYFSIGEEDLARIVQSPYTVIGSDGIFKSISEQTHPRTFGTFPHAIKYFVKEKGLLSLEKMIHKMTGQSAGFFRIDSKGLIRDGYDSDLVLFDYESLADTATYVNSNCVSKGIKFVIVGGEVVYQEQHLTGANPGRLLVR